MSGDKPSAQTTRGPLEEEEMFDTYDAEFGVQSGVGLSIYPNRRNPWLPWNETKQLAAWLAKIVEEGDRG